MRYIIWVLINTVNRLAKIIEDKIIYVPKRPAEPDCTWADIKDKGASKWKPMVHLKMVLKKC